MRHFSEVLPALIERGGPLSLLVIDLDGMTKPVDPDALMARLADGRAASKG